MSVSFSRPAWIEVDVAAIEANVASLARLCAPAVVCAVVKADGYGHGAIAAAEASVRGGAGWLAVATVEEGLELRAAGVAHPVLLLSEPPADAWPEVVDAGLTPMVYSEGGVACLDRAAGSFPRSSEGGFAGFPVHVKVDTGMNRVGASPGSVGALVERIDASPSLRLTGIATHLACADQPGRPETSLQLQRFAPVVASASRGRRLVVHAANSAGALAHPESRLDLVRCGIAVYGISPSAEVASPTRLEPALSLKAQVSFVHRVGGGEGVSYGGRYVTETATTLATVPLGYADGVDRGLGLAGGEVLVRGRRLPIRGVVTMDQLMVDCGETGDVAVGDEVVLIGEQGSEVLGVEEWATRLGTIPYEVLSRLGSRLPRRVLRR